ncbi:MAG: acetyl-CoA hydrolase/transferase family protein [Anaerovoracaceae bacterium]|jgi:4-hydroxybutyrate CoA-transferase
MSDWRQTYMDKLCTADEAVQSIKDGKRVLIAGAASRPECLVRALIANAQDYKKVRIMHGLSSGGEEYCKEEYKDNFIFESLFASKATRKYMNNGNVTYVPCYYYELPHFFRDHVIPINVFMVQVSRPDKYGYMSTGVNADFIRQAVQAADMVMVQVNNKVPWCASPGCMIHTDEVTHIIEYNEPLPIAPSRPFTEVDRKIGEYCAELVNDGDTIQIGIGNIPNAICECLMDKKDLGVHSEILSDGLMKLWKAGVVNNSKKGFDRDTMVACFAYGSQDLYDLIDKNPAIKLQNSERTNDPRNVARCKNFISINTCIEVDIMGQVVSGTSGLKLISGAGGQLDFVRGADMSFDGKGRSVVAFTSTYEKNGKRSSRILPHITTGSSVTVPRQDTDYFVTEYGIARIKGKNLKDRARALIGIAHPDYRDMLIEDFERRYKVKY